MNIIRRNILLTAVAGITLVYLPFQAPHDPIQDPYLPHDSPSDHLNQKANS